MNDINKVLENNIKDIMSRKEIENTCPRCGNSISETTNKAYGVVIQRVFSCDNCGYTASYSGGDTDSIDEEFPPYEK